MTTIELEQFAFDLLNDLIDNHGLSDVDQVFYTNWIWRANTPGEMQIVIRDLQDLLLRCLRPASI